VEDVYMVHINKHWIEKALRRLRKHPPRKKLGKLEMQVTYGVADRLPRVEGRELRSRFLNAIGADVKAYRHQKTDQYLNLGYHPGSRAVQVTFPSQEERQHHANWAEVALGVRSNLNITRLKVLDRRFGEEVVVDDAPATVMMIRARPSQLGRLRFFNPNRGHHSTSVEIFSTSSVPFIPAEMSQVRFTVGPLSLFVYTQARSATDEGNEVSLRATISWNYDHVCLLTKLGDAARAMRLMYAPATVMQIEAADPEFRPVATRLGNFPAIEDERDRYLRTVWAVSSLAKQVDLDGLIHGAVARQEQDAGPSCRVRLPSRRVASIFLRRTSRETSMQRRRDRVHERRGPSSPRVEGTPRQGRSGRDRREVRRRRQTTRGEFPTAGVPAEAGRGAAAGVCGCRGCSTAERRSRQRIHLGGADA
jgi:hypothetical protein